MYKHHQQQQQQIDVKRGVLTQVGEIPGKKQKNKKQKTKRKKERMKE